MTKTIVDLSQTLLDGFEILEKARAITHGAPFFMRCDEDFGEVSIDGDTALLQWPEVCSGYYNDCSIETQSVSFPANLLLMTMDEIKAWKEAEVAKHCAEVARKEENERLVRERTQRMNEISLLARLKEKYES